MKQPATRATAKVSADKNPALAAAARVKDLLARMTFQEEAAQMLCGWQEKAQQLVARESHSEPSIL
jgi:beta-glucosidase